MAKLDEKSKKAVEDQQWVRDNETAIKTAYGILMSHLRGRSNPSRATLLKARALVDRANEIAEEWPIEQPPATRAMPKGKTYRVRRKANKRGEKAISDNRDLALMEAKLLKFRRQIDGLRRLIDNLAVPLQRGEFDAVSAHLFDGLDGLAKAAIAIGDALAELSTVEWKRKDK